MVYYGITVFPWRDAYEAAPSEQQIQMELHIIGLSAANGGDAAK